MSGGHLGHLGNGMSSNYLSPDDGGAAPTLAVSADSLTGDPNGSTPADDANIAWGFSIVVGGTAQNSLSSTVTATNVNLVGPETGANFANLINAPGFVVTFNGITTGTATWTLTMAAAAVGTYTVQLVSSGSYKVRGGELPLTNEAGESVSASISASTTEVPTSTPSSASFGAVLGQPADIDLTITSIGSSPINTNTTQTWSVVTDAKNINTHNSLSVTVSVIWDGPATRPATAPTNVSITGWTMATAWNALTSGTDEYWQAVFTRATQNAGTSTMSFSVNSGTTGGLMKFVAEGASAETQTVQNSGTTSVTINATAQTYYTVRKTTATSLYDGGSFSNSSFAGDVSAFMRVSWNGDAVAFGLSADNPNYDYTGIDFGVINDTGTFYQSENGTLTSRGTLTAGDVVEIRRTVATGVVACYKNGVLAFTFTGTSTAALIVDSSLRFDTDHATLWITSGGSPATTTWTSLSATQGTVSLSTNATSYAVGATITVTFAGAWRTLDWLTVSANGSAWNSYVEFKYTNNLSTGPASVTASGTVTFTAPAAGTYVVRMLSNDSFDAIHQSATFTTA